MFGRSAARSSPSPAGTVALSCVTFKTSKIAFEILSKQPGLRPAPYLASRGMSWIQHYAQPGLDDESLKAYLRESHRLVSLGLTKKRQRELGLNQEPQKE